MTDSPPLVRRSFRLILTVATIVACVPCATLPATAAAPDLTSGGVPGDSVTINLGATGMRGWVHHVKDDTSESRQIQVTAVDAGSPADGVLAAGEVILGADGTGAAPAAFTADARRSLADAIAAAEARDPGILKLLHWRGGSTSTVQITLRTMGAYSATAPYNCPKSTKILEEGVQYVFDHETSGRYTFGAMSLLASGNPAYATRIQNEARALVPSAATMAQMMSDERDSAGSITWQRGHTLVFLAEYFLATGDAQVLPAVEAYAVNIAKNQSLFGTTGHIYAEKNPDGSNNGPMGGVYGVVNSAGMPCFLGVLLAKECGLTNPELDPAIERTSRFFASYCHKGAIPYGEHEPFSQAHENNGKSGLAAVAFCLQDNRAEEGKFFAKMCTASSAERERGHTGPFFNYVWAPLGAAAGGEEAAASFFSRIRWHLDLARRWDGSFAYDHLGAGSGDPTNYRGSEYHDFRMSTAALLAYALPLRELCITGKDHDPARWLSSADVAEAVTADDYDPDPRSINDLISDLGSWSPKVRRAAAMELGTRSINQSTLNQITALATDPNGSSRVGACQALGEIGDSDSASTLAALLTDPDHHVRFMAAEALRHLSTSAKLTVLNDILDAAASTAQPLEPFVEEDPLQFAHAKLAMLLFYSGNAYGPRGVIWSSVDGVDRRKLYGAIRAVAATPTGLARSTLSRTYDNLDYADVEAVAGAIVDSIQVRAPADKMFSGGVRQGGIETLQKWGIAEGVPLSMIYMENDSRGSAKRAALGVLEDYAGSVLTVVPDPEVIAFCEAKVMTGDQAAEAQAVLDAIANDPSPATLASFKSIESVTADAPALTLPADSTVLRVTATDHADGDSVFTWRKVHGAGHVTFTPNGTGPAQDTAIQFDGIPGQYLFEVTMSDSRGLTEVSDTVAVTLNDTGGSLPPNDPPAAHPQQVPVVQATPMPVTLAGTDPEGYALVFSVTGPPAHGSLSGTAPDLLYTPDPLFTGDDSFLFEVMDSEGQVASATVDITVNTATSFAVAIYEPFDYAEGNINGRDGGIGFSGPWDATRSNPAIDTGDKSWGGLASSGNHVRGSGWSGMIRPIGSALSDAGLTDNGATLWFSVVMDLAGQNTTNADISVALGTAQFVSSTFGDRENLLGDDAEGIGVTHSRANVEGVYWQDAGDADGVAERVEEDTTLTLNSTDNSRALVVGRIEWGADDAAAETLTLYAPGTDLDPGTPILDSWTTPALDQSQFDLVGVQFKDQAKVDEIRFAASYAGVVFGTTVAPPATDYDNWAATFPGFDLTDPGSDLDGDGITNDGERIWGLDPTAAGSMNPATGTPTPGTITYTRRDPALTGLGYTVWTSPSLEPGSWTQDTGAVQARESLAGEVETMNVTLSAALLNEAKLFVQVIAAE